MTSLFAQAAGAPAGGAEVTQVAIATSAALLLTAVLVYLGQGHRSGRVKLLGRLGDRAEALTGLPAWTSLPSGIATISLITAATGLYWDVSLHIDNGRDAGPLANPSHYLILGGLFGIFSAGWLCDGPRRREAGSGRCTHHPRLARAGGGAAAGGRGVVRALGLSSR